MLCDLVQKKFIRLRAQVADWKEAVRLSMEPLLEGHCIEQSYIDACIANVEKYGPYIVVTEHVALVHAERDKGCLKDAIGITVLQEGVNFGNPDNDPVKYLFSLSATGNDAHLDALAELSVLLQEEEFFRLLETAEDEEAVIDYLKKIPREDCNCRSAS